MGGVGGTAESVTISTQIRLDRDDGGVSLIGGEFAAFISNEALDMSVLGRDIMSLFAVIVDHQGNILCMIGQRDGYRIEATS